MKEKKAGEEDLMTDVIMEMKVHLSFIWTLCIWTGNKLVFRQARSLSETDDLSTTHMYGNNHCFNNGQMKASIENLYGVSK